MSFHPVTLHCFAERFVLEPKALVEYIIRLSNRQLDTLLVSVHHPQ